MSHHFILTKDQLPIPEPWGAKTYPTRTEAVLDAKAAAARLRDTITVTRIIAGGHWIDEAEVTDVSTAYLAGRLPKEKNTNCLEGLACPKCGNDERLIIQGESAFEVTDDGTGRHWDVYWDDSSHTVCPNRVCNFEGNLCEFREEQKLPEVTA